MTTNYPFNSGAYTKNVNKTDEEEIFVSIDWADTLETSDVITLSIWTADSVDLTLSDGVTNPQDTAIKVSGGTTGTLYQLTNTVTITTSLGEEITQSQIQLYTQA